MKTFIRAIEYWLPSEDGSLLEFGQGLYGDATRFATLSRSLCFGRGEGLPGQAWESGEPIVLTQFEGSYFRRTAAAQADGLTCGIALPIFSGETLKAVVVIFGGDDANHVGAIELWHNDPAESKDMTLRDGYYGNTGDTFEFISRKTSIRRGNGLPGMAWEQQAPVFFDDLGKGSGFLRADGAVKVGINRGFAVPCANRGPQHFVLAFLSALATPLAKRIEIWTRDADGVPQLSAGFCEVQGSLASGSHQAATATGADAVAQAFLSSQPALGALAASESTSGMLGMVAIPVLQQGQTGAVVGLYL